MLRPTYFYLAVSALLMASSAAAQEEPWELKRDRDGIQVYTRSVAGSPYKAVRASTVMTGVSLSSLVALIDDVEACPQWADRCAESYHVERITPTEALIYTHNAMPFPIKDRDVVARAKWSQDPDTLVVRLQSEAIVGGVNEIRGRLRLTEARVSWEFIPLQDGSIEVSNQAHIDPGSSLPGWVTNMLLVDTPFETLRGFRDAVTADEYQQASISFVQEP